MMKLRNCFLGIACLTLAALIFSGCETESPSIPSVQITITGLDYTALPAGSKFFSLSVFKEAAHITTSNTTSTKLGGQVTSDGLSMGIGSPPSITISVPEIPSGDYILVLGAVSDTSGKGGKMFITGTNNTTAKKVTLNFNSGASASFASDFVKGTNSKGWDVGDIVSIFAH